MCFITGKMVGGESRKKRGENSNRTINSPSRLEVFFFIPLFAGFRSREGGNTDEERLFQSLPVKSRKV